MRSNVLQPRARPMAADAGGFRLSIGRANMPMQRRVNEERDFGAPSRFVKKANSAAKRLVIGPKSKYDCLGRARRARGVAHGPVATFSIIQCPEMLSGIRCTQSGWWNADRGTAKLRSSPDNERSCCFRSRQIRHAAEARFCAQKKNPDRAGRAQWISSLAGGGK